VNKNNKEEISNNNYNKTVRKINSVLVYWCLLQYITTKIICLLINIYHLRL